MLPRTASFGDINWWWSLQVSRPFDESMIRQTGVDDVNSWSWEVTPSYDSIQNASLVVGCLIHMVGETEQLYDVVELCAQWVGQAVEAEELKELKMPQKN